MWRNSNLQSAKYVLARHTLTSHWDLNVLLTVHIWLWMSTVNSQMLSRILFSYKTETVNMLTEKLDRKWYFPFPNHRTHWTSSKTFAPAHSADLYAFFITPSVWKQDHEVSVEEYKTALQSVCVGKSYSDFPQGFKRFIEKSFLTVDLDGKFANVFFLQNFCQIATHHTRRQHF